MKLVFYSLPVRPVAEIIQEANIRFSLLHLSYAVNEGLICAKKELESLRQQLVERNRLLETLANIDSLTEIPNHRFFQNFYLSGRLFTRLRGFKPDDFQPSPPNPLRSKN